jgi:hypothetical protein
MSDEEIEVRFFILFSDYKLLQKEGANAPVANARSQDGRLATPHVNGPMTLLCAIAGN